MISVARNLFSFWKKELSEEILLFFFIETVEWELDSHGKTK